MRILSLNDFLYKNVTQHNISFKNNKSFNVEDFNGVKLYTDTFVNNSFETQRPEIISRISQKVNNEVCSHWAREMANVQRYLYPLNRVKMFNQLAHSFASTGNMETSAVALAVAMANVDKKPLVAQDKVRYKKIINTDENFLILKDFFANSKNHKARFFVINKIKDYNSSYFLPVVEDILEFDKDTTVLSDRNTSYIARQILHKFYNFNLLNNADLQSPLHQHAVLNILNKWGLFEDRDIVLNIKKLAVGVELQSKAQNLEEKLWGISSIQSNDKKQYERIPSVARSETKSFSTLLDKLFVSSDKNALNDIKKSKYPNGEFNVSLIFDKLSQNSDSEYKPDLIKHVGQTASFLEYLDCVKPISDKLTLLNKEKAEAYYKILLRTHMICSE